jgi:S-adenosylmethionine decarboxylase
VRGATGALVLAESHLAIHTWPEMDAVTLDLYVCNYSQDNRAAAEAAFEALRKDLQPARIVRRDIARGEIETRATPT